MSIARRSAVCTALVVAAVLALAPLRGAAEVEGFCTVCHKYPGLGRIEKRADEGADTEQREIKRVYYINNDLFDTTYHGKIRCKGCHTGVDRFPHTESKPVDCATDCHIDDPSVHRPFSHRKIVNDFNHSVHGLEGSRIADKEDLPVCKDCHSNKTYHASVAEKVGAKTFLQVCHECHESQAFTERFYEHMIYRTTKRRSSKEIVELCSTCHADDELMKKHDLDVVAGFSATFHAKAIAYGNEAVANCLNCHAPYQMGFSPHRIVSWRKDGSPVSQERKIETCRQSGCHAKAVDTFAAGGRVHPSRAPGDILIPALTEKGWDTLKGESDFQTTVLGLIRLFYMVLIAAVVGGLGLHWLLVLYAARREALAGRH